MQYKERVFPLNNPLSERKFPSSSLHQMKMERTGGRSLRKGGAKDYGLPMWSCPKCGLVVGPALLPERYQPCEKWQGMMESGKSCDGILVAEGKEAN